jgi:hypothetical protein
LKAGKQPRYDPLHLVGNELALRSNDFRFKKFVSVYSFL